MAESASATIEIAAVPEELFEIVTDLESYPEWLKGMESVEVLGEDEDGFPARSKMVADIGVRKVAYTLVYEYDYPHEISWVSEPGGDVKSIVGAYHFTPINDELTEVEYHLAIDPGFPVPGFLMRKLEKSVMREALDGLKERAESA